MLHGNRNKSDSKSTSCVILFIIHCGKGGIIWHGTDQWFPWATGKELTANGWFSGIFGRAGGDGTASSLDCGGG